MSSDKRASDRRSREKMEKGVAGRKVPRSADGGRGSGRTYTAEYKVNRSGALLEFLLAKLGTSRNNVKALLSGRFVLINGSVATRHDFPLAKDDEVKISKYPIREEEGRSAEAPRKRFSLKILYEDEDFIAVDKPAGLLSVESDKEAECCVCLRVGISAEKRRSAVYSAQNRQGDFGRFDIRQKYKSAFHVENELERVYKNAGILRGDRRETIEKGGDYRFLFEGK